MVFFVIFILSAVLIGVGAMLAPALPTEQPRIGLSASLTLLFVLLGGILWTQFIGWDTLVIDYLLFGVVSLVVLGGTMIQAHQADNEDDSEIVLNDDQWLNRQEFLFLASLALLCLISLLIPTDLSDVRIATAQTASTIEILFPQMTIIGATAFHTLSVYLHQQLNQDSSIVQQAVIVVLMFLCVFTAYDLGSVIKNAHAGKILALGVYLMILVGLWMQAQFYAVLPIILLSLSILIFMIRVAKYRKIFDVIACIILVSLLILI